jgi:hypothetical protein
MAIDAVTAAVGEPETARFDHIEQFRPVAHGTAVSFDGVERRARSPSSRSTRSNEKPITDERRVVDVESVRLQRTRPDPNHE